MGTKINTEINKILLYIKYTNNQVLLHSTKILNIL